MFDTTNLYESVGYAVVFVGGIVVTVKKYWPKIKKIGETVENIWAHLQKIAPVQQAVANVEVAATTNDKELREASLKAAVHEIGHALKVETDNLVDASPVISRYLSNRYPKVFADLTSDEVAGAIKMAQSGVEDLRSRDDAKLFQDVIRYANFGQVQSASTAASEVQTVPQAQNEQTAN